MSNPRVSVVTAVRNPPPAGFEDTVASMVGQGYEDWEWIVVGATSWAAAVDSRVRLVASEESGAAALNTVLATAGGELVALLDVGDVLEPNALEALVGAYDSDEVDFAYSDHDLIGPDGTFIDPYRKPAWSPERFRHHPYATHLALLRRALVDEVGGFREGFDGAEEHDLMLRVTEKARRVVHVPDVLLHRPVHRPVHRGADVEAYAWDVGVRAVQDHLDRVGLRARAERGPQPGLFRVVREPDLNTSVSVVIPTIGTRSEVFGQKRTMVTETVRSVIAGTEHRSVELIIVYDAPTPPDVLDSLRDLDRESGDNVSIRLVPFTEPFNFSAKCNVGAAHAHGDVLLFLNDDMETVSEGMIETLIAPLREPDVGMTGAKLIFEDERIQHAGVMYGSGTIYPSYYRADRDEPGAHGDLHINRECSALTGACIAMRREVFWDAGGFNEKLPINYNDVDLCLKVRRELGLRLVWLHDVVLFHFESVSRDSQVHDWEKDLMAFRWGRYQDVRERYSNGH